MDSQPNYFYNQSNYPQRGFYGYQPQAQPLQSVQPRFTLKGRPVSSIDEARGAQIDFDGSLFIFPDISNQRIYTKKIGMDGSATFESYKREEILPEKKQQEYVTKEEFESVISKFNELLNKKEEPQQKQSIANF